MNRTTLTPIVVPFCDDAIKVVGVRWSDSDHTHIEVLSKRAGRKCIVEFERVSGLRMLHELDLASSWLGSPKEALASTWLFQVNAGGWFDLECTRIDFYTQHHEVKPLEFLVAGYQECLSVLSLSHPTVYESTGA